MTDGKKNQGYEMNKKEGATSQKSEEGLAKTKTVVLPSKLTNRKYPTGDGIGAWIRPLRKKQ